MDLCRRAVQIASNVSVLHGLDPGNREVNTMLFGRSLPLEQQLPDKALAQTLATVASLPEQATRGPSAAEEEAKREAERVERRKRRDERIARIRTTHGIA